MWEGDILRRLSCRPVSLTRLLPFACLLVGSATPATAVDFTWTGATSDYFGTAGNWTPAGGPPNSDADRAIINSTGTIEFGVAGGLYEPTLWTNEQLVVELGIVTFDLASRAAAQPL